MIGVELDARLIVNALPTLVAGLAPNRFEDVARAILTTDLVMKTAHQQVRLKKGVVHIAGMTKGSGMIQPNMATTLGFVMTTRRFPPAALAVDARRAPWSAATTASAWTATRPPTTRCCCSPTAHPAFSRIEKESAKVRRGACRR